MLSLVSTLKVHKSENGLKKKCYEYKRKTMRFKLERIVTKRTAATTPLLAYLRCRVPKVVPSFT